jgi:hypothetical protein
MGARLVRAASHKNLIKAACTYADEATSPFEKLKWLAVAGFLNDLAGQFEADAEKTRTASRPESEVI